MISNGYGILRLVVIFTDANTGTDSHRHIKEDH